VLYILSGVAGGLLTFIGVIAGAAITQINRTTVRATKEADKQ
jgi:ABC-type branched-subunit amino acid transport system permease subunit